MGEYRRFVSYLYEDHEAEKGKNVGFVRVEVRGPQVSFRVGLKDVQGVGQAVLLSAGRELVALGTLHLADGRETEKLTADRENVQASGLRFEDFSGLRIELSDPKRNYQTFWDARVSPQAKFTWRGEENAAIRKEEQNEELKVILAEDENQEPEKTNQPEEKPQVTEKTILPEQPQQEEKKVILSEELSGETQAQSVPYTELWREEPRITWPQLQNIYPKLLPFGERDSWQVLRIHLQDIGRLPREYWILGNNDFVVHGYEAYHHLLLIHDPAGDITYLGVPGEELSQERRVAELFGFRRYRRAEPVGYWLTRIKL